MLNVSRRLPAQNISVELNTFQLLLFLIKNRCHNSFDTLLWLVPCLIYNYLEECLRQATEMGSICKLQYESDFKWHFGNPSKHFFLNSVSFSIHTEELRLPTQSRDNAMPWVGTMGWCFGELGQGAPLTSLCWQVSPVYVRKPCHSYMAAASVLGWWRWDNVKWREKEKPSWTWALVQ